MKKPDVALVHDYLVQYGGAEKTLEAVMELFPLAPIYTSAYKPENFPDAFKNKRIVVPKVSGSLFQQVPSLSKYFTFLNPLIFESFDLGKYDLIISDSSSYAKGVLTRPDQLHISYIHTPPRFLYKYSVENTKRNSWYYKPFVLVIDHFLRIWDFAAAQRPNYLVANSKEIQKRIKKFYQRDSQVIYPPVELARSMPAAGEKQKKEKYYLAVGRLVSYKNFDMIIKAFNGIPQLKLYIIGSGNEEKNLKSLAKDNVKFLGRITDTEKHSYMENCLGLINAVEDEDFGIVPIEVLSHGRPVLVHGSSGHLETVIDGINGMFFYKLDVDHLIEKIKEFDEKINRGEFDRQGVCASVERFSKENFKKEFLEFILDKWKDHQDQFVKQSKS